MKLTGTAVRPNSESSSETSPAQSVDVRVIRDLAEVESIRELWARWPGHRDSDIDFCLDYVWTGKGFIRPHIILLCRNGQPDALLVGRLEHTYFPLKIGYIRLPKIPVRLLTIAYGAFRGTTSEENAQILVHSIIDELAKGEIDAAQFHQLNVDLPIYRYVVGMPGIVSRDYLKKASPHYVMEVAESQERVFQFFSSGLRKELRRMERKLNEDFKGKIGIQCFREAAEIEKAVALFEKIASKTYQRGLGVGFRDDAATRRYLEVSARKGWLRMHILTADDIPCAFSIGSAYHGCFCSDEVGFDPKFRAYAPGWYLLTKMIQEFCSDGVKEIDFGIGEAEYKERVGNRRMMESSIYIFAPTLKGIFLNAVRTGIGLVDVMVRKALERTDLLPRIRRFWRSKVTQKPSVPAAPGSGTKE